MFIKKISLSQRSIFVLLGLFPLVTLAQPKPLTATVTQVVKKINDFNVALPAEKLHFQIDKPYYAIGDTLWFKGYLVNASLSYSPLSSRMYVELLNDSAKIVKRIAVPVSYGVTWGNISLDSLYLHEGVYTIRAYTTWMRNFNDEYTFYHSFYLSKPRGKDYLVQANTTIASVIGKDNAEIKLKFSTLGSMPVKDQVFQLKALNGNKVIYRGIGTTSVDGTLNANIPLPEQIKLKNLRLIAQPKNDSKKTMSMPLLVNRSSDIDLQFMPEGGALVTGLPSRIGFKAIGQDGLGVNIRGKVYNKENNEIAEFSTLYKGIGKFDLLPQDGELYTVKVTLPDGSLKTLDLPQVKNSGTVLSVLNDASSDTLTISIYASTDLQNRSENYYLTGQSRGVVCYAAGLLINRTLTRVRIPKNLFPTGIAHFTLLNSNQLPLNDRLTFINHNDMLKISIEPDRQTYGPRDSVLLHLKVNDNNGKGIAGSFSLAVTDDAQLKTDHQKSNILCDLLLQPDLHGYIEDPGFYFQDQENGAVALDALMLTQGWTGFDWKDITAVNLPKPKYLPEAEYVVSGKVTNLFNKPIAKANVTLLAKGRVAFAMDTITNASGEFLFHKLPPLDTAVFILQAKHGGGRVVNAGISVDNLDSPPVVNMPKTALNPWYLNTDSISLNFAKTSNKYHKIMDDTNDGLSGRMLRSVDIKEQSTVKGSNNLNGAGNADQVITEADIESAGKVTLLALIEKKVADFHTAFIKKGTEQAFLIQNKKVRFIIDGIDMDRFFIPSGGQQVDARYNYLRQTLDYLSAEDILGIEVLSSARYNSRYDVQYLRSGEIFGNGFAYLEITTRSGQGPFMRRATGIYVYKPLPTTTPAVFYSPRYRVNDLNNKLPDLRSTIYWNPNVVTDKNGEATVRFYTADGFSNYSVIAEGADLKGKIGYQTGSIKLAHVK